MIMNYEMPNYANVPLLYRLLLFMTEVCIACVIIIMMQRIVDSPTSLLMSFCTIYSNQYP
jgi:hypothetical protein